MYTLVFDTETTGLPEQPWIIQIAAILYRDKDRWPVSHFSTYLRPSHEDLEGNFGTDKFFVDNKLTAEFVLPSALETYQGISMFNQLLRRADRVVAHNMAFDAGRMRDTYRRLTGNLFSVFEELPRVCTMETLLPVMKLPSKFGTKYKWPNLDEAYRAYVDPEGFTNAHDAMNDVQACARVLFALEDLNIPLSQSS